MWDAYQRIVQQYPRIPLTEERRLIAKAKQGSDESRKEIVLRHIGFVIFRLRRRIFPEHLKRFGEDLLTETILVLYQKVDTYNLRYRDKHGNPKPVKFVSYIWKRVDGFILDFINEEIKKEKLDKLLGFVHSSASDPDDRDPFYDSADDNWSIG